MVSAISPAFRAFPFQKEEELSKKLSCKGSSCLSLSAASEEAPLGSALSLSLRPVLGLAICGSHRRQHVESSRTFWAQPSNRPPKATGLELTAGSSTSSARPWKGSVPSWSLKPSATDLGAGAFFVLGGCPQPSRMFSAALASTCQTLRVSSPL